MRTNLTNRVRAILRSHPDGLTAAALKDMTNASSNKIVYKRLSEMPDTYIDRWEKTGPHYRSVWCIVTPPDDCPHPTGRVVAVRPGRWKDFAEDAPCNRETND